MAGASVSTDLATGLVANVDAARGVRSASLTKEVKRTADRRVLRNVLLSSLTVLSLLNLDVPEASALHLFLLGNHLLSSGQLIVGLKLSVKVSLLQSILIVDLFDGFVVALSSQVLDMSVVDVTLHVVHRVFEVRVGCGSITIKRLINFALHILIAHCQFFTILVVHQERFVYVELGTRMRSELAEAALARAAA